MGPSEHSAAKRDPTPTILSSRETSDKESDIISDGVIRFGCGLNCLKTETATFQTVQTAPKTEIFIHNYGCLNLMSRRPLEPGSGPQTDMGCQRLTDVIFPPSLNNPAYERRKGPSPVHRVDGTKGLRVHVCVWRCPIWTLFEPSERVYGLSSLT